MKRLTVSLMRVCFLSAVLFAGFFAGAQTNSLVDDQIENKAQSGRVVFIDGEKLDDAVRKHRVDSIQRLVSKFYYDQFRGIQDPDVPYFMFMSKDAGLTLGIGGGLRVRAYYDWGVSMPSSAFSPYTIPIPVNPAARRSFRTTPSGTYLFLRGVGHNKVMGNYEIYVEGDFTGYEGLDFRLKKAYVTAGDLTVGYATSTFSDPAAQAPVIDAAGANNKMSNTSVLVRYMKEFKSGFYVAASVETPKTAVDVSVPEVSAVTNWLPDFATFVQYEWARGQHVRLSGIVRSLSYLDKRITTTHNLAGWGTQLSCVAHPEKHLTTYLTANYGAGYSSLGGDLMYGAYDLVGSPDSPGYMYAPRSYGWNLGVQYNFKPNLFASVSASQTRYLPRHNISPDEYKYGMFGCVNVFWSVLPRLTFVGEVDWGMRRNFSGMHQNAHRANLSAMLTF